MKVNRLMLIFELTMRSRPCKRIGPFGIGLVLGLLYILSDPVSRQVVLIIFVVVLHHCLPFLVENEICYY